MWVEGHFSWRREGGRRGERKGGGTSTVGGRVTAPGGRRTGTCWEEGVWYSVSGKEAATPCFGEEG